MGDSGQLWYEEGVEEFTSIEPIHSLQLYGGALHKLSVPSTAVSVCVKNGVSDGVPLPGFADKSSQIEDWTPENMTEKTHYQSLQLV